jgi:pyruvate formate lyase activating enzyme
MTSGIIFDIQRFSVHDGPGTRTTVFFKGCSLRCFWCHNPEGLRPQPEIQFEPERCIGCGECVLICPQGAQHLVDGQRIYERDRCEVCGQCVDQCFANGLTLVGRRVTVEDIMAEVLPDRPFYHNSGGGVTLSGGEPVLQTAFVHDLLVRCQAEGLHTALETAGHYPWTRLEHLLPHVDLVMMDLKHMDPDRHRAATGASNAQILANARALAASGTPVIFRVPVIPTVNDSPAAIRTIAGFVRELADRRGAPLRLELLPFHRLAENKYTSLGLTYKARALPPAVDNMDELRAILQEFGLAP